jgi:hypothetical protein
LNTIRKSQDVAEQRILKEEAEFKLLTSLIHGLRGSARVKIKTPKFDRRSPKYNHYHLQHREIGNTRERERYFGLRQN